MMFQTVFVFLRADGVSTTADLPPQQPIAVWASDGGKKYIPLPLGKDARSPTFRYPGFRVRYLVTSAS